MRIYRLLASATSYFTHPRLRMPLFEKRGRKQAFLLRGRGREKPSALRLGPRVLIAVRSLYEETIASVDAVHVAHAERARSPHGHSSSVDACRLEWRWHHSSHPGRRS